MAGRLTTHVLCTNTGRPAAGLAVELLTADGRSLARVVTNADGRLDAPLLAGETFAPGVYELRFAVGDFYRRQGMALPEPAFLDVVPIRFGMAEAGHYHVPLLVSPFGYSTYRGS